jgi:general stress protein YciG
MTDVHKQAYEANLLKRYPGLTLEEAKTKHKEQVAEIGRANKGRKSPNSPFTDKEKAREAGKKGAEARWSKVKAEKE